MIILVTGATGTNGREVVKRLVAAGSQVRAFVRNGENTDTLDEMNVEIVTGDLDKPETVDAALQGAEKAFLLTANTLNQVEQEKNFIEAAKRAGIRHLVKFSVMNANANSPLRLLQWHGEAENYLEESRVPYTVLRPNFFMQNMLWFAASIKSDGAFYLPIGKAAVSMVDVRDIAAVAAAALTEAGHEGKTYEITGSQALSFDEVAKKLSVATNKKIAYVDAPPKDFQKSLLGLGQPEWLADALTELYEDVSKGHNALVTDAVAKVTKSHPISFDYFARDYAQIFKVE